jgi:sugar phosphate isomerase/epimerase
MLKLLGTGITAAGLSPVEIPVAAESVPQNSNDIKKPFRYSLNTGTLLGYNLSIEEEIDITAQAGYDGIEIWMMRLEKYIAEGKKLSDLKKRLDHHGLVLENAIGFAPWIAEDPQKRSDGVAQMKRDMERIALLGGKSIAAPPSGATDARINDLEACGERYRQILEIGESIGVIPLLEVWGGSKTLRKLSDAVAVSVAAAHPQASLLLDAFHLYKGGNSFESLRQINGASLHVFHLNDYPADPPRETIADQDRVYPGDGVCPLNHVLEILYRAGFREALSLELFNRSYWDTAKPLDVARTGLAKMKAVAEF